MPQKRTEKRVCLNCESDFLATKAEIKRGRAKFCKHSCFFEYRTRNRLHAGENHPLYKEPTHSYICRRNNGPDKYMAKNENGKWVPRARLIMEELVGEKLKHDEVVHHINCNALDDRISNLMICKKGHHSFIHNKKRVSNKFYGAII